MLTCGQLIVKTKIKNDGVNFRGCTNMYLIHITYINIRLRYYINLFFDAVQRQETSGDGSKNVPGVQHSGEYLPSKVHLHREIHL